MLSTTKPTFQIHSMAGLALETSQLYEEQHDSEKSAIQVFETFKDLHLKEELLKDIKEYGYEKPSAVQQATILSLYNNMNMLAEVAESEPGKASAICLGILQKLDCNSKECQALVFTGTLESAREIGKDMRKLGASLGVKVHVLGDDDSSVIHVVVGPPHIAEHWLNNKGGASWMEHIKVVFLDQADIMVRDQFSYIFRNLLPLRAKYQVAVFTETMSKVNDFKQEWLLPNCLEIKVPCTVESASGNGRHQVISVENEEMKPLALLNLYNNIKTTSVVFVVDPEMVEYLVGIMKDQKWENPRWDVLSTNNNMNQKARDQIKQLLHAEGGPRVLITTEEWANGIDLKQVTLVVNYDLPSNETRYLHRMGRCGGAADAINFVRKYDWEMLFDIQEHHKNAVVFEGTPLQPSQVGPAGFSEELPEGIEEILKYKLPPEASKGIKHILYRDVGAISKPCMIQRYLKEHLEKIKSVIFAEVDLRDELENEGFRVFTVGKKDDFFTSDEDNCILLITSDVDTLKHLPPAKVPVVINCDPPLAPELYDHRIAWCGENGVAIHFVTMDDWFKVFHFQSPPKSLVGWHPSDEELANLICVAGAYSANSSLEPSPKRLKHMEDPTDAHLAESGQEPTAQRPDHFLMQPQHSELIFTRPKPEVRLDGEYLNSLVARLLGEPCDMF